MLELYHNAMSTCAQKVRQVLDAKGLDWQGHVLDLRAGDQFKPEFRRLNPKAVVPVLVHDGEVVTESNAIMEYLDEAFPAPALMPAAPLGRARVRRWLIQLDAGLHTHVATLSYAIAFRHQVLARHTTPAAVDAFLAGVPDPERAAHMRAMIDLGVDAPQMNGAIRAYEKLLGEMQRSLEQQPWLAGDALSLADLAYAPYLTRLSHLQLQGWWAGRPALADWFERMQALPCYQAGVTAWFVPQYLELMHTQGTRAWPAIADRLAAIRSGA